MAFVEVTDDRQRYDGEERWLRQLDDKCWISVLYRLTGFGWREWETAICFLPQTGDATVRNVECLMIGGDYRIELESMPKDQLREWYANNIEGNRNSMDTILEVLQESSEA